MPYFFALAFALFLASCSNSTDSYEEPADALVLETDSLKAVDSLSTPDSLSLPDSLNTRDSLNSPDSLCTQDSLDTTQNMVQTDTSTRGMVLFSATSQKVQIGTNEKSAKVNERPAATVNFTYDYHMDRHEVTCETYNDVMKDYGAAAQLECAGDSLPAVNVTYFDAVLYANARSKRAGRDTAYHYTKLSFNSKGHCIGMEGFAFDPAKKAFRLPTEAEWSFAAQSNWAPANSWNAGNSGYKLHKVCTAPVPPDKSDSSICDMAGNALEWVNDWMGALRDTSITNYVGTTDGGTLGERILKGGSFRNSPQAMHIYSRGDIYTVAGSLAADYVGFRLAYGAIPDAQWMSRKGPAKTSSLHVIASSEAVQGKTTSSRAKLAFRNDETGNLAFVDFGSSATVVEIDDTLEVYHPDISPDGRRVAFCTGLEGISGKSAVYVRDLSVGGGNLIKLDVPNAAIPRWRVLENGDTAIAFVTDAGNNKDMGYFATTATWQVKISGGIFGIPEKLFMGAYHGGISNEGDFAITGARLLIAHKERIYNSMIPLDTIWYNGEQACNASLSHDGTNRSLFLDFGGKTGRKFTGINYGTHEMLLVVDSLGKLIQGVPAPAGHSFDHTEWALGKVKGKDLVVSTIVDINGNHNKVQLLDMVDSSRLDLVGGGEVWHPSLWLGVINIENTAWDLDSAGDYSNPDNSVSHLFHEKMPMMWDMRDSVEVVAFGNSRTYTGFDPKSIELPSMNFSVIPCEMHCINYLFKNYIVKHYHRLKYIVVGLDFDTWHIQDPNESILTATMGSKGFEYDKNHKFWPNGIDDDFLKLVHQKRNENSEEIQAVSGYVAHEFFIGWYNATTGEVSIVLDSTWSDKEFIWQTNLIALKDLIATAGKKGVKVIGVTYPISPKYKETGSYGKFGLRRSHALQIMDSVKVYQENYGNFRLMDENKMGDHDYTTYMAHDYDHLNYEGAIKLSTRLDSLLKEF